MEIKTDFNIRDKVIVIPFECGGTVTAIFVCEDGIQFRIRYFYEGHVRSEYFYDDELRRIE